MCLRVAYLMITIRRENFFIKPGEMAQKGADPHP